MAVEGPILMGSQSEELEAHATVLLHAEESIKAFFESLGHADPGFTLQTYKHQVPSKCAAAVKSAGKGLCQPVMFAQLVSG